MKCPNCGEEMTDGALYCEIEALFFKHPCGKECQYIDDEQVLCNTWYIIHRVVPSFYYM